MPLNAPSSNVAPNNSLHPTVEKLRFLPSTGPRPFWRSKQQGNQNVMKKSLCTLLFATSILTACASAPRIQPRPSEQRICCQSVGEMQYSLLPSGATERVVIDDSSQAFPFGDGIGTFKAFELQKKGAANTLEIETSLSSGYIPSATILMPKILFLDSEKRLEQSVLKPAWTTRLVVFRGTVWSSRIQVPSTSKYAVVYFSPKEGESIVALSENKTPHNVPVAFTGAIYVSLK